MFLFVAWILFSIIPAVIASKKGRSVPGWFFLSLLISPLFAGILVACLGPIKKNIEEQALREGMRKCPFCAELVKREAKVCRYCQRDLPVTDEIKWAEYASTFSKLGNEERTKEWLKLTLAQRKSLVSLLGPGAIPLYQAQAKPAASVQPFAIMNGDGTWLFDLPVGIAAKLKKRNDALGDFIQTACTAGESDIPKIIAACGEDPKLKFIADAMQRAIPPVTLSKQEKERVSGQRFYDLNWTAPLTATADKKSSKRKHILIACLAIVGISALLLLLTVFEHNKNTGKIGTTTPDQNPIGAHGSVAFGYAANIPVGQTEYDTVEIVKFLKLNDTLSLQQMTSGGRIFFEPSGSMVEIIGKGSIGSGSTRSTKVRFMDNQEGWLQSNFIEPSRAKASGNNSATTSTSTTSDSTGVNQQNSPMHSEPKVKFEITRDSSGYFVVSGDTNLPDGTKLGVELFALGNNKSLAEPGQPKNYGDSSLGRTLSSLDREVKGYIAESGLLGQDFEVFVRSGRFSSKGFSNQGAPYPSGKYKAEILLHRNIFWQTKEILKQLGEGNESSWSQTASMGPFRAASK